MTMSPIQEAALERVEAAIKGRSLQGYSEVIAGDMAVVCGLVAEPDGHVQQLQKAALNNRADGPAWFMTERVAHLVATVKG